MSLCREKLLVSFAIQAIIAAVFFALERLPTVPTPGWLVTPLDAWLPFSAWAVWPYASWYLAPAVLLALDRDRFRGASAAVLVGFLACAAGWMAWPVAMERPPLAADAGATTWLLSAVWAVDRPRNIFPSFHATLCAILLRVAPGTSRRRMLLAVWVSAICVSCVLTKQHYVADVVAGLVVGGAASAIVERARKLAVPRDAAKANASIVSAAPLGGRSSA